MRADIRPLRSGCPSDQLAGLVDGSGELTPAARAHVDRCLRCQAEIAQYRKLRRALRDLRARIREPDPDLMADILDRIDHDSGQLRDRLGGRRSAYIGGIAAATAAAAGAGAAIVYRVRRAG